ncbi:MAG: universal stress protein [Desulfovermiculus sp.]|nr:universal stress protein [Desulfovermiculus sp.]
MYKSMVIAVNQTEASSQALEQSLAWAASEESNVVLVSVVPGYDGDLRLMGDSSILRGMREPYIQALDRAAERAATWELPCKKVLRTGEPGEEILTVADEEQADLIVIGKKTSPILDLIPIGSASAKVLKLSNVDILVIPQDKELKLDKMLVAYDGSKYAEKAAQRACSISLSYGCIYFLATIYEMSLEGYIVSPDVVQKIYQATQIKQKPIVQLLEERGVRQYEQIIEYGDPVYRALVETAKRKEVGLTVMGSRGSGSLSHILLGSVVARFVSSGACPTLIVKGGARPE